MPKHRKFLKSEKAKIKFKGAKLPKGLNVTKTDFKVKKIVIRDQITNEFNVDGTIIRSIKEILSKLKHHNVAHRTEGLHYLKDMLANQPDETNKQLGTIIKGLAPLCLDIERNVRHECYKALNILLSVTSPEILQPFFDILTTYLKCAMTHIKMNIQEDSLFLLDSLLLHSPMLVADNSTAIFSCFLDMISKLRVEAKPERMLSINLGSKITSMKWRSKVLDRLLAMLKTICRARDITKRQIGVGEISTSDLNNQQSGDAFTINQSIDGLESNTLSAKNIVHFDVTKPLHIPLIRQYLNENCDLPMFYRKSYGLDNTLAATDAYNERSQIKHHVEQLMPLIFETWMEVRPAFEDTENNEFDKYSVISNEAAFTLKTVLEIIDKIHQIILHTSNDVDRTMSDWFVDSYSWQFSSNFLLAFPYNQLADEKKGKTKSKAWPTDKKIEESGGLKCTYQNLMICNIFCILNRTINRNNERLASRVIDFVNASLTNFQLINHETAIVFIAVVEELLIKNAKNWSKSVVQLRKLLTTLLAYYQRQKFPKECRTKILILLCRIVQQPKLIELFGNELFNTWLKTLPKLLCSTHISAQILQTFSTLAKQKNIQFLQIFSEQLSAIIANLTTIQFSGGINNRLDGQRIIVNLLFWLNNDEKIKEVLRDTTDHTVVQLINEIMMLKKYQL